MTTSIVIPALNQLACCEQCIRSIQRSAKAPYKLILVDNGSTDGVSEYFDSIAGATVVHSETNLGFASGVNLGMRETEGDVLLLALWGTLYLFIAKRHGTQGCWMLGAWGKAYTKDAR